MAALLPMSVAQAARGHPAQVRADHDDDRRLAHTPHLHGRGDGGGGAAVDAKIRIHSLPYVAQPLGAGCRMAEAGDGAQVNAEERKTAQAQHLTPRRRLSRKPSLSSSARASAAAPATSRAQNPRNQSPQRTYGVRSPRRRTSPTRTSRTLTPRLSRTRPPGSMISIRPWWRRAPASAAFPRRPQHGQVGVLVRPRRRTKRLVARQKHKRLLPAGRAPRRRNAGRRFRSR